VRALLRELGIRPRKRWGQHFLCDGNVARRIIAAAEIAAGERVLEIGPGLGALTEVLLQAGAIVTAVERDPVLAAFLARDGGPSLEVITGDFPRCDLATPPPYKVVSNLPYYVTTPIIESLLVSHTGWSAAVLTMQTEVAERLAAGPAARAYGALSLFAQFHSEIERLFAVPASCFYPPPEVESTVVRLRPLERGIGEATARAFRAVVRAGFGGRRKTLHNSLRAAAPAEKVDAALAASGIDSGRRAETLTLEEFLALAGALATTS
jgi:16S rRNA (adenine1518-N6/adenine1519-N6)-dimethyltransferase